MSGLYTVVAMVSPDDTFATREEAIERAKQKAERYRDVEFSVVEYGTKFCVPLGTPQVHA